MNTHNERRASALLFFASVEIGSAYIHKERADMLYLKQTTTEQEVYIPRNYATPSVGAVVLTLNDVMGDGELAVNVTAMEMYDRAYKLAVKLSKKATEGEYEYTLRIGGEVVATGLAQVGDYKANIISYDEETDIEQYDEE